MRVVEFKPPGKITYQRRPEDIKIFLAGSIEMGKAEDWQSSIKYWLSSHKSPYRAVLFNPRRNNWDSSWEQEFSNAQFYQQVNWELNALEQADIIIMNILPDTKSPISLLELGLYTHSGKLMVCCPEGFYRKGNIDIVCDRFGIPLFEDFAELLINLKSRL